MDTTIEYYISLIASTTDKRRKRKYQKELEREISEYRLTAYNAPGRNYSRLCNKQANWIERMLNRALNI